MSSYPFPIFSIYSTSIFINFFKINKGLFIAINQIRSTNFVYDIQLKTAKIPESNK
jgi:hypothetical protein